MDLTNGNWQVVDLTQPISPRVPTFEGTNDSYKYELLSSLEHDGCMTGRIELPEHFGTHVDAPIHFVPGLATIDRLPVSKLILQACVIDVRQAVVENPDYALTVEDIRGAESVGAIARDSAVLLLTGWDSRFENSDRYRNADCDGVMHFPGYSLESVRYLIEERHVAALGIDTLSIDPGIDASYAVHNFALKANVYLVENLTRLAQLPERGAILFCGPLAIEGGSGSPARVLALVLNEEK